jgi:large subunit ribosomal protein L21
MFAVITVSGKQYKVSPQDIIEVDKIAQEEGSEITFTDVLLKDDNGTVTIGHPVIAGSQVKAKVLKQFKGEKINVRRYKSKVRYRKSIGFRPSLTQVQIEHIA